MRASSNVDLVQSKVGYWDSSKVDCDADLDEREDDVDWHLDGDLRTVNKTLPFTSLSLARTLARRRKHSVLYICKKSWTSWGMMLLASPSMLGAVIAGRHSVFHSR